MKIYNCFFYKFYVSVKGLNICPRSFYLIAGEHGKTIQDVFYLSSGKFTQLPNGFGLEPWEVQTSAHRFE